ncbi:seminal metalloprotease 1 [Prorops nasuta]|uniref:seminal metalloprotease 1 n=1 Tax=Prorops nasuta TaxID=863751 RepID=UPI0034CE29D7
MIYTLLAAQSIIYLSVICFASTSPAITHKGPHGRPVPPDPRFVGVFSEDYDHEAIAKEIMSIAENDPRYIWELSGLYEGDIMIHPESPHYEKNGVLDSTMRWHGGVVPYYIVEDDFDQEDIKIIEGAFMEYHNKTCLRFRPYKETDQDYVKIQSKNSGCWSLVGRHGEGQLLNLQNPGCVHHGVVIHEMMHALGFFHQQSAADRDEWVTILWQNIKFGREHNFNKYDNRTVTDYGVGYDYKSVMHYSSHAFSKNGEPTITPKKEKVKLGQREGLSEKDVMKVQGMYKDECQMKEPTESSSSSENITLEWFFLRELAKIIEQTLCNVIIRDKYICGK